MFWKSTSTWLASLAISLMSSMALANSVPFIAALTDKTVVIGELVHIRVTSQDLDGVMPDLRLLNPPNNALFTDNGDGSRTFLWVPREEDAGVQTFEFEAIDAEDSTLRFSRQLKLKIVLEDGSTGNRPPSIATLENLSITLGSEFNFPVFAVDPEATVPTLSVEPLPVGATFEDNFNGTRQFRWVPSIQSAGTNYLTFTAIDADEPDLQTRRTIKLEVIDVDGLLRPRILGESTEVYQVSNNRAPAFTPIADQSVALGKGFNFNIRAFDVDGTEPEIGIKQIPYGASLTDNSDGSKQFKWLPMPVDVGDNLATFLAIDSADPTLHTELSVNLNVFRDSDNSAGVPASTQENNRTPLIYADDIPAQQGQPGNPDKAAPPLDTPNNSGFHFNNHFEGIRALIWPTTTNNRDNKDISAFSTDPEGYSSQKEQAKVKQHSQKIYITQAAELCKHGCSPSALHHLMQRKPRHSIKHNSAAYTFQYVLAGNVI